MHQVRKSQSLINRTGIFKYSADIMPVTFVSAACALSLLPFLLPIPLWVMALYWPALMFMRSFCPYAQHNHAHLPVFNHSFFNRAYDVLLAQTTGYQTALWELHHNRGHHRNFLTPERDVARVVNLKTGKVFSRPWYALRGNLTIHRDSLKIALAERAANQKSLMGKLSSEFAIQLGITIALLAWNPLMALACFVIPNAFAAWYIWWESYPHHLEAPTSDVYDGSVTITGRFFNLTTFNIGHHTAHHEKPTLHWSLLPARTEAIRAKIPEALIHRSRSARDMKTRAQALETLASSPGPLSI